MKETGSKKRVMFVCMGNICRSPAGEGVLKKLVADRKLQSSIDVASAGTISYHVGEMPDPRMRKAAEKRGITLNSRAQQLKLDHLEDYDLIIAMDRNNYSGILELDSDEKYRDKVKMLSHFLDEHDEDFPVDVPDPYYGGPRGFETVLDMIESAAERILDEIQK